MLVNAEVEKELKRFVRAKLWTGQGEPHADENSKAKLSYGTGALPLIVILDAEGKRVAQLPPEGKFDFLITKEQLLEELRKIQ